MFVAVVPPIEVVEDLSEFVEPRREHPDDDIRWAADEHWHITLAFLGDVPDWKSDELGERFEGVAKRQKPFALQLTGAGAFPGVPDARVLYAGVRDETESLKHLSMTTRAAANRAGPPGAPARHRSAVPAGRAGPGRRVTPTCSP